MRRSSRLPHGILPSRLITFSNKFSGTTTFTPDSPTFPQRNFLNERLDWRPGQINVHQLALLRDENAKRIANGGMLKLHQCLPRSIPEIDQRAILRGQRLSRSARRCVE